MTREMHPGLDVAIRRIYAKAEEFREQFADEDKARTLEWAASQLEAAIRSDAAQLLSLSEAASQSGYSEQHLSRLVREGRIPDLRPPGSKGRILIRLVDLPTKPGTAHIGVADEHGLASRLFGGTEA